MNLPTESRLAARAVALHTEIPLAERKELLAMIGLLDDDGQYCDLQGTLTAPTTLGDSTDVKVVHHREAPWDRSSVPPGLRDLPPPAPEPKSTKPKVEGTGCGDKRGTLTGRRRHQAKGTPVCKECAEAYATWQRDWKANGGAGTDPCGDERGTLAGVARHKKWRAKMCPDCAVVAKDLHRQQRAERRKQGRTEALPTRSDTCGSMAGRSNHLRRGEKLCRACKDTQNAYQRERRRQQQSVEGEQEVA